MILNLFSIYIFLIGLVSGSFLNCVIHRLYTKESFLKGRSYCPKCKHLLEWYDLIPVLSYLVLLGKCRYCKKRISLQYPIIEITTALLFLLVFNFQFPAFNKFSIFDFQKIVYTLYLLITSCFLIIIFVYDLKHYLIPDKIVLPAIFVSLIYNLLVFLIGDINLKDFLGFIYAGLFSALFFFLIFFFSQGKWMGFGDVKLALFLGLFLGWPKILVALFMAFFFGGIIGVGLIVFKKKTFKSEIPFGPFLISGTMLALFWGQNLIAWYLGLIA